MWLWIWQAHAGFVDDSAGAGVGNTDIKDGGSVFIDYDHDGDLDIVFNTDVAAGSHLLENDGSGLFTDVTALRAPGFVGQLERSTVAVDLNQDGYVDFVRNQVPTLEVFLNRGPNEQFQLGGLDGPDIVLDVDVLGVDYLNMEGVGFLDIDTDGDFDLCVDNHLGIYVYENDGASVPSFTVRQGTGLDATGSSAGDYTAFGDVDADGDIDFIDRKNGLPDLYVNQGDGSFVESANFDFSAPNNNKGGVIFCDVDDDGDLDLFWSHGGSSEDNADEANQFFENQGGAWVATGVPALDASVAFDGVDCGDTDHDGDLDLYLAGPSGGRFFRNDGAFSFVEVKGFATTGDEESAIFGDVDADGDLDLFVSSDGGNRLYRNDQDDDRAMIVLPEERVGAVAAPDDCVEDPVLRTAWGTLGWLDRPDGTPGGLRHVNTGKGHGSQGVPYLHFGLTDGPDETYVLRLQPPGRPRMSIQVTPNTLANGTWRIDLADPDGDGIDSTVEGAFPNDDVDGDGFVNAHDPDADGDGIEDAIEAGIEERCDSPRDTDGDGLPDVVDLDADDDGVTDDVEGTVDTDGDGQPDYLDLDSDNDGIVDAIEGHDADSDGVADVPPAGVDADDDGLDDAYDPDRGGTEAPEPDGDSDGVVDRRDVDDDGDGLLTAREPNDTDGDGQPDYLDLDSDDDGRPDATEAHDIDEDGESDRPPTGRDADGDGLDEAYDPDEGGEAAVEPDHDGDGIPAWQDPVGDENGDGLEGPPIGLYSGGCGGGCQTGGTSIAWVFLLALLARRRP